eukprot:jgi/Hompol1/236/HPOL_001870-RA
MATGSTDEQVKLYDLRIRKEVGTLMHHSGTITSLQFFGNSHLFTASEDGTIGIVRSSDWELLKTLKGHQSAVHSISVHPTGKILLSVGKDRSLRCWDLTRGLCAYSLKLNSVAEKVAWCPVTGSHYAILFDKTAQIFSAETGQIVGRLESKTRINAMVFTRVAAVDALKNGAVVLGGEDRTITIAAIDGTVLAKWKTSHGARIKDLAAIESPKRNGTVLASCATDGGIFLWDLADCIKALEQTSTESAEPSKFAEYDAKCRLTCVALSLSETRMPKAEWADEADAAAAESDYEDTQIKKPTLTVRLEGEHDQTDHVDANSGDQKQHKQKQNPHHKQSHNKKQQQGSREPASIARQKHKVKKLTKKISDSSSTPKPANSKSRKAE